MFDTYENVDGIHTLKANDGSVFKVDSDYLHGFKETGAVYEIEIGYSNKQGSIQFVLQDQENTFVSSSVFIVQNFYVKTEALKEFIAGVEKVVAEKNNWGE